MALLLSRVDGFSYQEVADNLGTSVSAVKSLIFRATATLRRDLAEWLLPEASRVSRRWDRDRRARSVTRRAY
jgi:hypothetical protein